MENYRIDFFGITEHELTDQINNQQFDQLVFTKFQADLLNMIVGMKIENWEHNSKDSSNKNLPHLLKELKTIMKTLDEFPY